MYRWELLQTCPSTAPSPPGNCLHEQSSSKQEPKQHLLQQDAGSSGTGWSSHFPAGGYLSQQCLTQSFCSKSTLAIYSEAEANRTGIFPPIPFLPVAPLRHGPFPSPPQPPHRDQQFTNAAIFLCALIVLLVLVHEYFSEEAETPLLVGFSSLGLPAKAP